MSSLWLDLRFARRNLSRNPGFVATAVAILAVAVGLGSAVFSLVQALVLRPLPVSEPERLVRIYSAQPGDFMSHSQMASADVDDLRDRATTLTAMISYFYTSLVVEHRGDSGLAMGAFVSGNYFAELGVIPALGRGFAADDRPEEIDVRPVAVLSHAAWQRRFGRDPDVLGCDVLVNGRAVTVIGVAPRSFPGLTQGISPELWLPSGLLSALGPWSGQPTEIERRQARSLWVLGRLAPEASFATAEAELTAIAAALEREFPETNAERRFEAVRADQVRVLPGVDGRLYTASVAMMGVVALVLLIASANLANLLLARAAGRRREMATRLALGASRQALIRQLLTESLVLAVLGGLCGLWLAAGSNALLTSIELPVPVHLVLGLEIDATVFLFTFAVSALAALAFGMAPALEAARTDLVSGLRGESLGSGRSPGSLRRVLVVAQVAVSFILLIFAGLTLRSLRHAEALDPGFESEDAVVATFAPRLQGYDRDRTEAFYERLLTSTRALPGVTSATLASHLPLSLEVHFENVAAERQDAGPIARVEEWPRVDATKVGPQYFATLKIPLIQGRGFAEADSEEAPRVAVINETLAGRLWPDTEAVGQRLHIAGVDEPYRVVGVAADGKYRTLGESPQPHLFLALAQNRWRGGGQAGEISSGSETLVARVRGDAGAALHEIRRVARELDESIAIARLTTFEDALQPSMWMPRMAAALLAVFGAVGLVLAATGLYGLMAFLVRRRIPELGLRQALGARRSDLMALIVRDGLKLTSWGLVVGLVGALAVSRGLTAWLYGIGATDPATFIVVTVFLASIAGLASWLPARRAVRVEPIEALRHDG